MGINLRGKIGHVAIEDCFVGVAMSCTSGSNVVLSSDEVVDIGRKKGQNN